jgi:flagellar biosynthesis GTPase FlhF
MDNIEEDSNNIIIYSCHNKKSIIKKGNWINIELNIKNILPNKNNLSHRIYYEIYNEDGHHTKGNLFNSDGLITSIQYKNNKSKYFIKIIVNIFFRNKLLKQKKIYKFFSPSQINSQNINMKIKYLENNIFTTNTVEAHEESSEQEESEEEPSEQEESEEEPSEQEESEEESSEQEESEEESSEQEKSEEESSEQEPSVQEESDDEGKE